MSIPLAHLHTDTVFIQSPDGARSKPYKTRVSASGAGHSAMVFDESLAAEEGWLLVRELPGGREETYQLLEMNFSRGHSGISPYWTLKLRKTTSLVHQQQSKPAPSITINNSQGIQIGDHNVQHIASALAGLAQKIEESNASAEAKAEAKSRLGKLIESPVVASVLGSAVSGVLALLSGNS